MSCPVSARQCFLSNTPLHQRAAVIVGRPVSTWSLLSSLERRPGLPTSCLISKSVPGARLLVTLSTPAISVTRRLNHVAAAPVDTTKAPDVPGSLAKQTLAERESNSKQDRGPLPRSAPSQEAKSATVKKGPQSKLDLLPYDVCSRKVMTTWQDKIREVVKPKNAKKVDTFFATKLSDDFTSTWGKKNSGVFYVGTLEGKRQLFLPVEHVNRIAALLRGATGEAKASLGKTVEEDMLVSKQQLVKVKQYKGAVFHDVRRELASAAAKQAKAALPQPTEAEVEAKAAASKELFEKKQAQSVSKAQKKDSLVFVRQRTLSLLRELWARGRQNGGVTYIAVDTEHDTIGRQMLEVGTAMLVQQPLGETIRSHQHLAVRGPDAATPVKRDFVHGRQLKLSASTIKDILNETLAVHAIDQTLMLIFHAPTGDLSSLTKLGVDTDDFVRLDELKLIDASLLDMYGQLKPDRYIVDTQKLYETHTSATNENASTSLHACGKALAIDVGEYKWHNAGDDAAVTLAIFERLM